MSDENDIGGRVGLDTTDFKAGVADLNRQIKVIDTGFRAAAAGMDNWGKSEEGLNARISSLNQITELQRQKVANLTEQYNQVAAAQGVSSRAAQDLQVRINNETATLNRNVRELFNTTTALNNLGQESNQTSGHIDNLASSSDDAGKSLKEIGGNIAKGVVIGIAAIGAAAVAAVVGLFKFSNDTTKAMNNLQTQTGATDAEMQSFRDTANKIYADNFGESVSDIASSMALINQVTKQTGNELKDTTEQAILMRDTFGFEVADSIDTVNGLMKNFGITAKEAYTLLAQGAQNGANKNGDLLDLLSEYGIQFSNLGLSAEDFTNTLIEGAKTGAFQIDKVGDAVKEFEIRSKDGSATSSAGFKALGLDANQMFSTFAKGGEVSKEAFQKVIIKLLEMKDPVAQNQAGVALFGTQFEDLGLKGMAALAGVSKQANMSADSLDKINNTKYNDIGSSLEGLKRKLITSISGPLDKEITPRIEDMTAALGKVDVTPIVNGLGWIIDNASNIATGAIAIGAGMATWKIGNAINGIVLGVKSLSVALTAATGSQTALNVAMSANIIGLIALAVAMLVAEVILVYRNFDMLKAKFMQLNPVVKMIVASFLLLNPATGIVLAIVGAIKGIQYLLDADIFGKMATSITGFFISIYNGFIQWGTNLTTWVTTTVPLIINSIINFFKELPANLGFALGFALGTIIKFGIDLTNWAITMIPQIIGNIINFFNQLPGKISGIFNNVKNSIINWGVSILIWASNSLPGIVNNVVSFFEVLPGKMVDIGVNIVKGLWSGIKSMVGWLTSKVSDFAGGIVTGMKKALDIHSPSRVMRDQVGFQIGAGVAVGIQDSTSKVNSAMAGLNKQVVSNGNINLGTTTSSAGNNNKNSSSLKKENTSGLANGDIIIPIYLDSEVMAKGTARNSDLIQGKNLVFQGRMAGL